MWTLKQTTQFKKDLKRYQNNKSKLQSLQDVLQQLQTNGVVDESHYPHPLKGNYIGSMECHVEGDFLLIWVDDTNQIIKLIRLGSHSELF